MPAVPGHLLGASEACGRGHGLNGGAGFGEIPTPDVVLNGGQVPRRERGPIGMHPLAIVPQISLPVLIGFPAGVHQQDKSTRREKVPRVDEELLLLVEGEVMHREAGKEDFERIAPGVEGIPEVGLAEIRGTGKGGEQGPGLAQRRSGQVVAGVECGRTSGKQGRHMARVAASEVQDPELARAAPGGQQGTDVPKNLLMEHVVPEQDPVVQGPGVGEYPKIPGVHRRGACTNSRREFQAGWPGKLWVRDIPELGTPSVGLLALQLRSRARAVTRFPVGLHWENRRSNETVMIRLRITLAAVGALTGWMILSGSPLLAGGGRLDPAYHPRFEQRNQPYRIHPYPDGRLLLEVAPDVIDISGTEVRRLARVFSDGTIDTAFVASPFLTNAFLNAVFPQPDGGVYVYLSPPDDGNGSSERKGILHLTEDGRRDEAFRLPMASESEAWHLLAVQPDGRLLVVRDAPEPFYGRQHQLVRLLPTGHEDPTFSCAVNDGRRFEGAWVLGDGRIAVRYTPRERVLQGHIGSRWGRLQPGGGVDQGWQPPAELNVTFPGKVAVGPDGIVFMVGFDITPDEGVGTSRAVQLLPSGQANPNFQPSLEIYSSVEATAEGHWRVLVQESPSPPHRAVLIELDGTGTAVSRRPLPELVQGFPFPEVIRTPGDNLMVLATSLAPPGFGEDSDPRGRLRYTTWLFSPANEALQFRSPEVMRAVAPPRPTSFPDGKLLFPRASSEFESVDGQFVTGTAVLGLGGELDRPLTLWLREDDTVTYSATTDGRVLAHDSKSGWLSWMESNGTQRPMAIASPYVRSLRGYQLQSDLSQIVVKDEVSRVSPQDPRNPRTVRTDTPQGGAVGQVLADDRILLWGPFTGVAGWISPGLARLLPSLDPDRSFRSSLPPGTRVQAAFAQRDGRVVVAVDSQTGGAPTYADILRLSEDGTPDPSFRSPGKVDGAVHAVSVDHQGRILLGGAFRSIDGVSSASVIRLNPGGTVDESFVRGEGADRTVRSLFVQPDDRVVVHGDFRRFDGEERWGLARLDGGHGALEPRVLGVSQSRAVPLGHRVVVGAVTAGEPPLTFQWHRLGNPLAGETNATLVVSRFSAADAGAYELHVGNRHGSAISPPCELHGAEPNSEAPVLSLVPRRRQEADFVLLGLSADPLGKHRLEGSSDFVTWSPMDLVIPVNGFVEIPTPGQWQPDHPFLRVVSGK